jgi:phage terminase small subunit
LPDFERLKKMSDMQHLRPSTRQWIEEIQAVYVVPSANLRLLILAGEALDIAEQARQQIAEQGLAVTNSHGTVRTNPLLRVAHSAAIRFAQLTKAAGLLDAAPPAAATATHKPKSPRGKARKMIT